MAIKKKISERKIIIWNVINSLLAGGLVVLGSCSDGGVTPESLFLAFIAASIVALSQFKSFWAKEEDKFRSASFGTFL